MASVDVETVPRVHLTTFGKKRKTGLLYVGKHALLKPVHNCVSGRREVDFYQTVFHRRHGDDDDVITSLRSFLPRFLGVEERAGVRHIKLENIQSKFRKPCMLDIKMGHVTSDPFADPQKVEQRRCKYPYAEKLGFALSGLTVRHPLTGETESIDKHTCHNFTLNQVVVDGLGKYFGFPSNPRKDAILCLLHKLRTIRRWFLRQRQFNFYASSLLIVYEGDAPDIPTDSQPQTGNVDHDCHLTAECCSRLCNNESGESSSKDTCSCDDKPCFLCQVSDFPKCSCVEDTSSHNCQLVDVRLIDFTHALPVSERDDNYLSGLDILIRVLALMCTWG